MCALRIAMFFCGSFSVTRFHESVQSEEHTFHLVRTCTCTTSSVPGTDVERRTSNVEGVPTSFCTVPGNTQRDLINGTL
jgi:hypothetical protein